MLSLKNDKVKTAQVDPQQSIVNNKQKRTLHCVSKKNIPNIFDCNLKKDSQISITFGMNIPETTCH